MRSASVKTVWTHDGAATLANATFVNVTFVEVPSHSAWALINSWCAVNLAVAFLADPAAGLADECAEAEGAIPFRPPLTP